MNITEQIERLKTLGFNGVSDKLRAAKERKRKLMMAYEHYRVVSQKAVDTFNAKLKKETRKGESMFDSSWKTLDFCSIATYDKVPPESVLASLEVAQGRQCFDSYEVAYIREVKDPILFGRITACPDRFFIDQWDTDVTIKDLLKDHEG